MPARHAIITPATFRFFRDLTRHNSKEWMDANRDRYRADVVEPFRVNFSRINRDIRFAKDKTPYRPQMYLTFPDPGSPDHGSTQLFVGISSSALTSGLRSYAMGPAKSSPLTQMVLPRVAAHSAWFMRQMKRLGRRYESYWYSTEKGEWTKNQGWPLGLDEWEKLKGWVVRRKFPASAASRPAFVSEITGTFRDVYPLFTFVSSPAWKL
jgi:hypothetical protein